MVKLKTKQNRIYAIRKFVRNLKGGKEILYFCAFLHCGTQIIHEAVHNPFKNLYSQNQHQGIQNRNLTKNKRFFENLYVNTWLF